MWRLLARNHRAAGDLTGYERAARTAAIIERRPWKRDRPTYDRPAPPHSHWLDRQRY
jgi:hypothetical protein